MCVHEGLAIKPTCWELCFAWYDMVLCSITCLYNKNRSHVLIYKRMIMHIYIYINKWIYISIYIYISYVLTYPVYAHSIIRRPSTCQGIPHVLGDRPRSWQWWVPYRSIMFHNEVAWGSSGLLPQAISLWNIVERYGTHHCHLLGPSPRTWGIPWHVEGLRIIECA